MRHASKVTKLYQKGGFFQDSGLGGAVRALGAAISGLIMRVERTHREKVTFQVIRVYSQA